MALETSPENLQQTPLPSFLNAPSIVQRIEGVVYELIPSLRREIPPHIQLAYPNADSLKANPKKDWNGFRSVFRTPAMVFGSGGKIVDSSRINTGVGNFHNLKPVVLPAIGGKFIAQASLTSARGYVGETQLVNPQPQPKPDLTLNRQLPPPRESVLPKKKSWFSRVATIVKSKVVATPIERIGNIKLDNLWTPGRPSWISNEPIELEGTDTYVPSTWIDRLLRRDPDSVNINIRFESDSARANLTKTVLDKNYGKVQASISPADKVVCLGSGNTQVSGRFPNVDAENKPLPKVEFVLPKDPLDEYLAVIVIDNVTAEVTPEQDVRFPAETEVEFNVRKQELSTAISKVKIELFEEDRVNITNTANLLQRNNGTPVKIISREQLKGWTPSGFYEVIKANLSHNIRIIPVSRLRSLHPDLQINFDQVKLDIIIDSLENRIQYANDLEFAIATYKPGDKLLPKIIAFQELRTLSDLYSLPNEIFNQIAAAIQEDSESDFIDTDSFQSILREFKLSRLITLDDANFELDYLLHNGRISQDFYERIQRAVGDDLTDGRIDFDSYRLILKEFKLVPTYFVSLKTQENSRKKAESAQVLQDELYRGHKVPQRQSRVVLEEYLKRFSAESIIKGTVHLGPLSIRSNEFAYHVDQYSVVATKVETNASDIERAAGLISSRKELEIWNQFGLIMFELQSQNGIPYYDIPSQVAEKVVEISNEIGQLFQIRGIKIEDKNELMTFIIDSMCEQRDTFLALYNSERRQDVLDNLDVNNYFDSIFGLLNTASLEPYSLLKDRVTRLIEYDYYVSIHPTLKIVDLNFDDPTPVMEPDAKLAREYDEVVRFPSITEVAATAAALLIAYFGFRQNK